MEKHAGICHMPLPLDCPIKSGNDIWFEMSFRGRTGVIVVSPSSGVFPYNIYKWKDCALFIGQGKPCPY